MSATPADAVPCVSIPEAMYRINHWWRVTRGGVGLGFARRSVIGRVIEEGCQGASHDRGLPPAPWMAPADEQVDRIMARMPPELRAAVVLDQEAGTPMKVICAKLSASPAQVRRWIENGYGFVAGMLTAARATGDGAK